MKYFSTFFVIFFCVTWIAEAQLRKDLVYQPEEYTAGITHTQGSNSMVGSWMNLLNMTMSHSYSMNFSNFAGQTQNINAYTNHMFFDISDKLNAQVDISLLHSPFGNSFMNNNNLGTQIIVEQARLNYKISPNTHISLQFSQRPAYYGFGAYGRGHHSMYNRMPPGF